MAGPDCMEVRLLFPGSLVFPSYLSEDSSTQFYLIKHDHECYIGVFGIVSI